MRLLSRFDDLSADNTQKIFRILFLGVIVIAVMFLVVGNLAALGLSNDSDTLSTDRGADSPAAGDEIADTRGNITVITSEISGYLLAINPDGTVKYYDESHYFYYDVDPSPVGNETVVYSALDVIDDENCESIERSSDTFRTGCTRQVIERANLTTGEVTQLHSRVYPKRSGSEWHDVDRVNDSHFVVADMYDDEVYIVDTETGVIKWGWEAQEYLSIASGGPYPDDWTHLNDVEYLSDGRIMVSLRNQDQVVFLNRSTGVVDDWTIGSDGELDTLYAQHNPDYIPEENGGPAVVIADSENNRIIEYERTESGAWNQSWVWGSPDSSQLEWPRDGDRLPNGNTLITDTHNDRLVEIDRDGEVVWSVDVSAPYEAERLGTGDESQNGPSAASAQLQSRSSAAELEGSNPGSADEGMSGTVRGLLPAKVVHGLLYTLSLVGLNWIGIIDVLLITIAVLTALIWAIAELYWSDVYLRSPIARSGE